MFKAVIVATLCYGWVCKAIHGSEWRHELKGTHETEEQCRAEGELVLKFAAVDPELKPRVVCEKVR